MSKIKRLLEISIIKTIWLNYVYFGMEGVLHLYIIVSKNVKIKKAAGKIIPNCILKTGIIKIGLFNVSIVDNNYERSIWSNTGTIVIHGKLWVGAGIRIENSGILEFGDNVTVTGRTTIICTKNIIFGNDVLCSWDVLILDTDFHCIYSLKDNKQLNPNAKIHIGNHVWIGCRCMITKGADIEDNNVIASCSKISQKVEIQNSILGNEGKKIKENVIWGREFAH